MKSDFTIVWLTTHAQCTPHAAALRAANPDLPIHISAPAAGGDTDARCRAWRNCDRNIRSWWREHRGEVETKDVIFMEYDVFCTVPITDAFTPLRRGVGAAGAAVMMPVAHARSWWPFREVQRLPEGLRNHAIGIAPLAVLQLSSNALDEILDPSYDDVFSADIFCELRLPTVIRDCGYKIAPLDLPNVGIRVLHPHLDDRGIFHPVKQPVL